LNPCIPHHISRTSIISVSEVATMKIRQCHFPSFCLKLKYPLPFSGSYVQLIIHSSTNQKLFEKHHCNKSSHYEKYGQFLIMQGKPSCATTKLMLFTVSKDEWNVKEDAGKSLKNALDELRYAKRHLSG